MDYTLRSHEESGQNKTKSTAGRSNQTKKAEDYFIRVTNLRDRKLSAPIVTAEQNQCREKMSQHPLLGENLTKLADMAELLSRKQNNIKRFQWTKIVKDWET